MTNPALYKKLRSDKAANLEMLSKEHQIGEEDIEYLYLYARFQYDCGNYSGAAEFLKYYRLLCNNGERAFSALWGKFASDILMQDWDESLEDLNRIKEVIDKSQHWSALTQLTNRTWFVHWSLFVFFNHESGRNAIIDVFFQARRAICRRVSVAPSPRCFSVVLFREFLGGKAIGTAALCESHESRTCGRRRCCNAVTHNN